MVDKLSLFYQEEYVFLFWIGNILRKKSRIRETKHLLTDAESSTHAIGEWTKNTQKSDFFFLTEKNHQKLNNSETIRNMTKLAIRPSTRGL